MSIRLAIIVSHPIQYFAPLFRELAKLPDLDLKVFFCCDWGVNSYLDPQFETELKWDVPLLDGYSYEFLPIGRRPESLSFWEVDNPSVSEALDRFCPGVVMSFGYAHRTNWRAARWARRSRCPLLLFSDSNVHINPGVRKRLAKRLIVGNFYRLYVDGAFCIGENNRMYHMHYGVPPERQFEGVLPTDTRRLLESVPDRTAARASLRRKLGIPDHAFLVMFCGKYQPHKRPLDLVLAVYRLLKKQLPIWCVLVGDGPERRTIASFCKRENATNVVLAGFTNQSQIASFYAAADALAMPSSLDAYGVAVAEACGFGLPIIVSDRVGCIGRNDSARPERNAIVYPCGDVEALASAIERLWRDPGLCRRMGAASCEIASSSDLSAATRQLAIAVSRLRQLGRRLSSRNQLPSLPEMTNS